MELREDKIRDSSLLLHMTPEWYFARGSFLEQLKNKSAE